MISPVAKITEYDQSAAKAQVAGSHNKAASCTQVLVEVLFSDQDLVLDVWHGADIVRGFFLFGHETVCRDCTVPQHVCAV